jgi:hypothetical protein
VTDWQRTHLLRWGWANRVHGHECECVRGGNRRGGMLGRRFFYGPNAERKAVRDRRRRA